LIAVCFAFCWNLFPQQQQGHSLISCLICCPRLALMVIDINKTFLSPKGQKPIRQQSLLNKLSYVSCVGGYFCVLFSVFAPIPEYLFKTKD